MISSCYFEADASQGHTGPHEHSGPHGHSVVDAQQPRAAVCGAVERVDGRVDSVRCARAPVLQPQRDSFRVFMSCLLGAP